MKVVEEVEFVMWSQSPTALNNMSAACWAVAIPLRTQVTVKCDSCIEDEMCDRHAWLSEIAANIDKACFIAIDFNDINNMNIDSVDSVKQVNERIKTQGLKQKVKHLPSSNAVEKNGRLYYDPEAVAHWAGLEMYGVELDDTGN